MQHGEANADCRLPDAAADITTASGHGIDKSDVSKLEWVFNVHI